MKKVCVVIGSRANYSSIKSAMLAIKEHPDLSLQIIATTSSVLASYGRVVDLIKSDGFEISAELFNSVEGESPETMTKSTGLAIIEMPSILRRLAPDYVVSIGDRYETMATVLAAAYMNIPLVHTMGGEVTGTIDESIRHAVTKFAHIHFAASEDARERILRLGEPEQYVFNVGCPRLDLVAEILAEPEDGDLLEELNNQGVGDELRGDEPFILVSQHPVTTEFGKSAQQIRETLLAVQKVGIQSIILWPNSDAGSDGISKEIRRMRERGELKRARLFRNLPNKIYVRLMDKTACLVGNSSSGVREGAFQGTPVVNVGSRQNRRERGQNVIDTDCDMAQIEAAIRLHMANGKLPSDPIYGTGDAGMKIAEILARIDSVNVQKLITY